MLVDEAKYPCTMPYSDKFSLPAHCSCELQEPPPSKKTSHFEECGFNLCQYIAGDPSMHTAAGSVNSKLRVTKPARAIDIKLHITTDLRLLCMRSSIIVDTQPTEYKPTLVASILTVSALFFVFTFSSKNLIRSRRSS